MCGHEVKNKTITTTVQFKVDQSYRANNRKISTPSEQIQNKKSSSSLSAMFKLSTFVLFMVMVESLSFHTKKLMSNSATSSTCQNNNTSCLKEKENCTSTHDLKFNKIERITKNEEMIAPETPSTSLFHIPKDYQWESSTTDNYRYSPSKTRNGDLSLVGEFSQLRQKLDYGYHSTYQPERQIFQDTIIRYLLSKPLLVDKNGNHCQKPSQPWIVFTAGAMGAGKSYTVRQLAKKEFFPLESFVVVDPDEVRRHLPEFEVYVKEIPERAGELTRIESGMISELLTLAALSSGRNVLVDGSLKDYQWYQQYFHQLRQDYPRLKIAILHITAPKQAVLERAENRSKTSGRVVPQHTLLDALERVPKSVQRLSSMVDFVCELNNTHEVTLESDRMTWDTFRKTWEQSCNKNTDNKSICDNEINDSTVDITKGRSGNFPKSKL